MEPDDECETIEARARDWLRRHGGETGPIDPEQLRRAVKEEYEKELIRRRQLAAPLSIAGTTWSSIGPTNVAGRVVSIAPHPTTAGLVYVGSATGGVWKTTDSGATWSALTEGLADLSIGAIAVAPSSPNTIYLGTGEPVGSGIPGIGFLSSPDGGSTWNFPGSGVLSTAFWKLSVHPTNALDVLAGTASGGFRSTDGGANWTPWTVPAGTAPHITDIVRDPSSASTLYATTYGGTGSPKVLKSTNGGSDWTDFSSGLPTSTAMRRMMLGIDSTGTVLYAAFDLSSVAYVYKSTSGAAWANTAPVNSSALYYGQGSYNNAIIVAPGGSTTVVVCGGECSKTTTGGSSWAPVYPSPSYHVDIHDLRFDAGGTLYIGTDGGIFTSADVGGSVTRRDTGMVTTQFYGIANDPVNATRVFGGTQDNGTWRRDGTTTQWTFMTDSDGAHPAVNRDNPSMVWTSNQAFYRGNHLWRTKDAGNASSPLFIQLAPTYQSSDSLPFTTLIVPDPIFPAVLYTNTDRLWKSSTGGDTWTPLPTTTTDGSTWNSYLIATIAIAKSNHAVMMVGKGADVFRSTDGGSTWRRVNSGLPGYWINDLDIDPWNANVAYAALSANHAYVYVTTNGGTGWTLQNSGLPDFAVETIRVDPTDSTTIYCGTDVGVYRSTDSAATWSLFGTGMPKAAVYDLRIADDGSILRAGTFGRGVWELQIPASLNHPPTLAISSPATQTVAIGTTLTFTGTVDDIDDDSVTANWSFSDTWERAQRTSWGTLSVTHTFSRPGIWPVTLAAQDEHGAASASTVVITVNEGGDTCASAIVLPNSGTVPATLLANSETWTSYDATDPRPSCTSRTPYYSGWFAYTAPSAASYTFSTCGSTFDTILGAYSGSCGSLSEIAGGCSDNADAAGTSGCPGGGSRITVSLSAGEAIRLLVYAKYYGSGQGLLSVTVSPSASTAPTVTRIAMAAGSALGGTPVTLYGSNFVAGANVTFGGTPATAVTVATPYIINAVTPAHSGGSVDVVVSNPDTQAGRLINGFTYSACTLSLSGSGVTFGASPGAGQVNVTATSGCSWAAVSNADWLTTTSAGIGSGSVSYGVALNPLVAGRSAVITIGDKTFTVTQSGILPYNFSATATSATSISTAWFSSIADHFEVWRNDGTGYALAGTSSCCAFTDGGRTPNTTYVYKVRAIDGTSAASAFTTPDAATTILFTDDPLTPHVTVIKAVHLAELRQAVNAFRVAAVLGPISYTDDGSVVGVPVRLLHLTDLRSALDAARLASGVPPISWSAVTTGSTVNAAHFTELRNGVK